jgi:hypothetical protein
LKAILRLAGGAGASAPFAQDVIDAGVGSLRPGAASSSESDEDNEIRRMRGPPELNDMFFAGSFGLRRVIGGRLDDLRLNVEFIQKVVLARYVRRKSVDHTEILIDSVGYNASMR